MEEFLRGFQDYMGITRGLEEDSNLFLAKDSD
jgi:hypothetical protein